MEKQLINFIKEDYPELAQEILERKREINKALEQVLSKIQNEEIPKFLSQSKYDTASQYQNYHKLVNKKIQKNKEFIQIMKSQKPESVEKLENIKRLPLDTRLGHNIYEDFTNTKPLAFEFEGKKYRVSSWTDMLVKTCHILYKEDSYLFKSFLHDREFNGEKKKYFSKDKCQLKIPRKIPDSDIYLDTCANSNEITRRIRRLLQEYNKTMIDYLVYLELKYTME